MGNMPFPQNIVSQNWAPEISNAELSMGVQIWENVIITILNR